jgi:hypothetical protein
MTPEELAELYPEGRTLFFEGDEKDLPALRAWCSVMGIEEPQTSITLHVPAEKLAAAYARWKLGS